MAATTIVYLHGFNSAPQSVKGQLVARGAAALADPPCFHLPALDHRPSVAMRDVCAWIDANWTPLRVARFGADSALGAARRAHARDAGSLAFIGSSLGGYYATYLAERYGARAIVVNPAIRPERDLRPFLGRQCNLYTGAEYDVTPAHLDELSALRVSRITRPDRYFLLARTGDELLDWRESMLHYAGAFQYIAGGGDHGWADFGAEVPAVLRFAGCRV